MKARSTVAFIVVTLLIIAFTAAIVVGVPFGVYEFKPTQTISLGLDLTGGVYAVYEADSTGIEDFDSKLSGTMTAMRNRLDSRGFTEATITQQGDNRIRVEIPVSKESQITDPHEISEFIGTPAHLTILDTDKKTVIVEGEDMIYARAMVDSGGDYVVSFKLGDEAAKRFAEATTKAVQQYGADGASLDIQIDGETISSPTVHSAITGGEGQIQGSYTLEEAENLAAQIESGALPLTLSELEVRSITATLGETALSTSIQAGIIGFCILLLFMLCYYRGMGLVADIALIAYVAIVLFCVSCFKVQLTLPGIAGIILGIGMAVDANVIIFERVKEEFYAGKSMRSSVKSGFRKAFSAIADANVTTIIAAIVLAIFGTGSIKGFAYTLAISIVVSMLSAVVISRGMLNLLIRMVPNGVGFFLPNKKKSEQPAEAQAVANDAAPQQTAAKKGFYSRFKIFAIVPAVIIVVALVFGIVCGGLNMGLDFTGGSILTITLGEHTTEDVKGILDGAGIGSTQVTRSGNDAVIRIQNVGDDEAQNATIDKIMEALKAEYPDAALAGKDSVGGVASSELIRNAFLSVLIACALMLIYIWIRFELLSGIAAIVALIHDVLIMICIICIMQVQINSSFIAACLTIVGYSINNTIVVFDRVRENRRLMGGKYDKAMLVDTSIKETLTRTINTTVTTLIMIVTLYIMGVSDIKEFALPIVIGLFAGAYSSVFLSAALWMKMERKSAKKKHSKVKAIS